MTNGNHSSQDPFETLIGAEFTPSERLELSLAALSPYVFEPITPSRAELIDHFDTLLELLVAGGGDASAKAHTDRFLDNMAATVDAEPGSPVKVKSVKSLITVEKSGTLDLTLIGAGTDLFGDFAALIVGPWYDIPEGVKPRDPAPYKRDNGLIIVLSNPRLARDDIVISGMEEEIAMIPLNHGDPELFRVFNAPFDM